MGGEAAELQLKIFYTNPSILLPEPRSVLDRRRSPSPPTSTSTLSSSLGGVGVSAATVAQNDDKWSAELPPIPASIGTGFDEWETMLAEPAVSPAQDQTFFRWIMGDAEHNDSPEKPILFERSDIDCYTNDSTGVDVIPESFVSTLFFNQHQQQMEIHENPAFFLPLPAIFGSQQECQLPPVSHLAPPVKLSCDRLFSRGREAPGMRNFHPTQTKRKFDDLVGSGAAQQQLQGLVDELFMAAELVGSGNSVSARVILARLNHQLPSPLGKPLFRTAFYFKEALQLLAEASPRRLASLSNIPNTPMEVVLKLRAYKTFSDVSPVVQFANFTCIQALLDEIGNAARIHIIDCDIGIGGQWSALMQELVQRSCSAALQLKITALVSPGCYHPLELHLTQESLCQFAAGLNISFEFSVLSLDPFDPELFRSTTSGNDEVTAVNIPLTSATYPSMPTVLRFIKQLSPKILISVDHGCDRSDLPLPQYVFHAFQSCTVLLESLDAAGANQETISNIERFIVQPRIENSLLGRHQIAEKILPWRSLFSSNGFLPVQFSNSTETQAECLLKRVQVRGFTVEKRHGSLSLCWQRGELVSISAWKC